MSNGYLVAAGADVAAAHEISDGFGLDVIDAASIDDSDTAASALAGAANVGLLISSASANDAHYLAVLRALAQHLQRAQLILVDADARAALPFLPEAWPAMMLDEARARATELVRRRDETASAEPQPGAPTPEAQPPVEAPRREETEAPASVSDEVAAARDAEQERAPAAPQAEPQPAEEEEKAPAGVAEEHAPVAAAPPPLQPPAQDLSAPNDGPSVGSALPSAPPQVQPVPAPMPSAPMPSAPPKARSGAEIDRSSGAAPSAPADATAFAPKKLRRGAPELVQVTIHQPKDLKAVIKAAKKANPNAEPAPQGVHIGDIALGASIGVALEARGVSCDGAMQRRPWRGEPLDFSFSVEPEDDAKKAVFIARVFVDDAQIGVIGFTRPIAGPAKKPASIGDGARLKRHKRVFLSYSSKDRETVAAIATAYQAAGIPHFWDRASLKSGEEWSPRLRKEIDRADLFHLCWSKAASTSEWVEKETEHALTRRKRSNGKAPDITVQMLDGPPWAPHPPQLDAINFDDFVRAAIVGYARGDGST